jgi:hypothetical protein
MVPHPRTAARPDRLRPLNQPRPVVVLPHPGSGGPAVLVERGERRPVAAVRDRWRIEDEWWREPISRRYYQVVLDDGTVRTLYRDAIGDRWFEQAY